MPEFKFNPKQSIIICHAEIVCPRVELSLKMALDTGATYTAIPVEAAIAIGCDPLRSQRKIEITMGSGIEYVPIIIVPLPQSHKNIAFCDPVVVFSFLLR